MRSFPDTNIDRNKTQCQVGGESRIDSTAGKEINKNDSFY